ncbi:hypothetical protein VP01_2634g2 [Puccinia sorghi]|uniref:Uncharacterized protein n=1 Tax=Puccinia sorghi TaxID=27349 RepID=A0A0L6V4B3_9BASI|nr:hypothetical protein VP01_2634g2 [Puccinia sorghi]
MLATLHITLNRQHCCHPLMCVPFSALSDIVDMAFKFNNILSPLVDELIRINTGILIPTHQSPSGRFVQVKLLCLYGDVLATKKVTGYTSHSATKFCSFCHEEHSKIPNLKPSRRREKEETISSATKLKEANSSAIKENILRETGVQCSELDQLVYWDPSRHDVLGVMHNWLKGILQGHFCYRWKFGCVPPNQAQKKHRNDSRTNSVPTKQARIAIELATMDINDKHLFSKPDDDDDEDIILNGGSGGGFFFEDDVERFCTRMKQAVLPPGVPHLPLNLGEAKHGKLSSSQWHALFVIYLHSNWYKFLANTPQLIACTNVVF